MFFSLGQDTKSGRTVVVVVLFAQLLRAEAVRLDKLDTEDARLKITEGVQDDLRDHGIVCNSAGVHQTVETHSGCVQAAAWQPCASWLYR